MSDVPFKYIRETYDVPAEYNRRVIVNGRPGIIVKDCGNYIGVNFDDEKPTDISRCHPTWRVQYLEIGLRRKLTRSQMQYQDYLEVADCYESFSDYLKSKRKHAHA